MTARSALVDCKRTNVAVVGLVHRLFDWFRDRLFGAPGEEVHERLDQARVLEIARAAVPPGTNTANLLWAVLQDRAGIKIWFVSEAVIGSALFVEIDDATEAVLSVGRRGLR